jgi:hypothetical protein
MSVQTIFDYKKRMGRYTILFIILSIIFVIILSFHLRLSDYVVLFALFSFDAFAFASVFTFGLYMNARRYLHLLGELGADIVDAELVKGTLVCSTKNFGRFYTDYIVKGRYGSRNIYRLWITTYKRFPVPDYKSHYGEWIVGFKKNDDIITNIVIFENKVENIILDLPEHFPISNIKDIKSLREIKLMTYHGERRIFMEFSDLWPHKETHDLISALEILRKIEEIL